MANSGSKSIAVTSYDTLKFSWSQTSQSVANNTTTISWKLELIATSYGRIDSSTSKDWSVTVNGTKYSGTNTVGISNNTTKTLASGSTTISHSTDGTKTFSYSFSQEFGITFSGSYIGTKSGSGTGALNTIKRASALGTISSFTLGNSINIPITKYSSSFTDSLTISLNGTTIKTVNSITNGYDVSFTSAELTTIYGLLPSSTTGTFTFKLTTKNGSSTVGTSTKSATGTIPSSVKPSISSVTITEANTAVALGVYVQKKSKLKVVTSASSGSGSSISSIKVTVDGKSYTGSTVTTNALSGSGTLTITVRATDKRNRYIETSKTISVLAYNSPYVTSINVIRSDQNGNALDSGSYAKVSVVAGVSGLNGLNLHRYYIKYKKTTDSTYTTQLINETNDSINQSVIISNIDSNYSYDFIAVVNDSFESYSKQAKTLMTAFVTVDYRNGGKGIAFGKVAENNNQMDINFPMLIRQNVTMKNGLVLGSNDTSEAFKYLIGLSSSNNAFIGAYSSNACPTGDLNLYGGTLVNIYSHRCGDVQSIALQYLKEQTNDQRNVFRPETNSGIYLGTTGYRFNTAFFTNAITASDLKEKYVIENFDFKVKDFVLGLKPIAYKRIGEGDTGKRIHLGFGAQTTNELIKEIGLGNMSLIQASIIEEKEVFDHEIKKKKIVRIETPYLGEEIEDSKLQWGINYNEFIAPLVLMIQQQQKEIDELKKAVNSLMADGKEN